MLRILSIIALFCLTTYTYGQGERTLSDDFTSRKLTMFGASATEDVPFGRTQSSIPKCPDAVARIMEEETYRFGDMRCEPSDTEYLDECDMSTGIVTTGIGVVTEVENPDDSYVCCWACHISERCTDWEWSNNYEDEVGICSLHYMPDRPYDDFIDDNMY